jgi:ACS family hexuronate transporter-like MFS transporter
MGLLNCGVAVGSVIAPPLIAFIIGWQDWRIVFYFAGAIGILWSVWWIRYYQAPSQHPGVRASERQMIEEAHRLAGEEPDVTSGIRWMALFRMTPTWGLLGAKFLSDAAWFIYATWLAKYLFSVHGFDTKQVGYYAWIPYAAAGIGSLGGGALATWLMHRGRSAGFARKLTMGLAALLMPCVVLVIVLPVQWAIVIFSVVFFGHQAWSSNLIVLPTDLYPRRIVGSIAGLMGCSGALGGVIFGECVGAILQTMGPEKGYPLVFICGGCLHVLSLGLILLTIPKVKMLSMPSMQRAD